MHRPPRLHRHGQSGYYYALFYDRRTRKTKWVALGTDKKGVAQQRFTALCADVREGRFDPLRDTFRATALTFEAAASEFVKLKERQGRSRRTVHDYHWFLTMCAEMLPAGLLLSQLTESDCRQIVQRPASDASRRGYHRRLRAFLRWCVGEGYLEKNPLEAVTPPRTQGTPPPYLTREEFERLARAVLEDAMNASTRAGRYRLLRLYRTLCLAVSTGLRLGELRTITWAVVDLEADRLTVTGKGGRTRTVPILPAARDVLEEIRTEHLHTYGLPPAPTMPVLPGLPYHDTCRHVTAYLERTGLKHRAGGKAMHLLRSTFASWLVSEGVSIFVVSRWLGHATVTITEQAYASLAPDYVPEAAKAVMAVRMDDWTRSASRRVLCRHDLSGRVRPGVQSSDATESQ
ncbi:MAG: hypothetical protein KatS3mg051_1601 [Anaerolineae bacterium]|nr:MAG: hypothetical protein KatS3mg051_1601 [Anaerolineae bacterium]